MKTREFLAQCERANWATAECAAFKARVDGCPDPTLILTSPDQPDCGSRRSPVEMEAAIAEQLVACNSLIRPTGPDVDPCRDAILARFQDPETPLAFEECDPTITDPCPDPGIVIVESNVWCAPEVPGNLGGMPEFCVQTGPEPFPGPGPEHWISIPVVGGV